MKEPYLKKNVILCEYTRDWAEKYEAEKKIWNELLNDNLIEIHHIGSTAIGNIKSKPIVDILVVVKLLERLDNLSALLIKKGYEVKGENGIVQ